MAYVLATSIFKPTLMPLKKTQQDTVGSCSMLPRELNGVVDPQLKVYGTKNVRVVDVSIIPLHVAAHTQSERLFSQFLWQFLTE